MPDDKEVVVVPAGGPTVLTRDEPPVVARLVVEIRSDGTRTVARGAIQDASLGQEVAIKAEGTTPFALALSLVKAMVKAPFLGTDGALKAIIGRGRRAGRG